MTIKERITEIITDEIESYSVPTDYELTDLIPDLYVKIDLAAEKISKQFIMLNPEQVNLIKQALGIAEKTFSNLSTEIISKTIRVTGFTSPEQSEIAKFYWNKSNEFYDLQDLFINS